MTVVTSLSSLVRSRSALLVGVLVASSSFAVQYHLMATMAGHRNEQCVVGAGLHAGNIAFGLLISLLAGMVGGGVWLVARQRFLSSGIPTVSLSGLGMFFGILTGFCTLCALPVLSLFGISFGLGFVSDHLIAVRLLSVALLLSALYRLDGQLRGQCQRCAT